MAWEITWNGSSVNYTFGEEDFSIDEITRINRKSFDEPSGGYKEPNDSVMVDVYEAITEHGTFEWTVTAKCEGFNGYADIDDVQQTKEPKGCTTEIPVFEIENESSENL
ncbi:hypothetical protein HUO09_10305 [Vibrio sp. Y2-5]|uniref:hypothetical protein n=1 Tax=Vibrio sp. Y2-5 TaxID=2743977 RepID=UPI0016605469|nr:hypothetical protein [Vibrio sp. Y2-5]MBD0786741.1 hypothetical protein [Vibrio sp. Y2-5]